MNARGGMPRSRSGLEILHHAQRPVGPFWDYDIFTTSRQPTRFSALTIHHLQVLVNDGDEWGWGGIDNIKDGDSKLTHCFFGIIEVNSRNSISDYGAKILDEKGVNLSPRSGTFFVKIKANFDRYELSRLTSGSDRGTWITSVTDRRDPYYQTYRISSHDAHTYKHSRRTRERAWWLSFIRDCCTPSTDPDEPEVPPVRERTIEWLVHRYKDKYPVYPSALNPSTDGPPRNVHKGEVYHELARHADFIKAALMGQRPRQMEASKWDTLQTDANHHHVRFGHGEDKPWEDKSQSEEEEDNLDGDAVLDEQFSVHQDPYPHASAYMSRLRVGTSPPNDEGSRTAYSSSVTPQTVFEDFSPEINNAEQTIIHTPKFDVNFTYRCVFNSLRSQNDTAAPTSTRQKTQLCPFKIDLLRLSPDDRNRLERAFHQSSDEQGRQCKSSFLDVVRHHRLSSTNKHTPLVFAVLMHAHFVKHQEACSATPHFATGHVEVEMPFRLSAFHQVDDLINSRNYDAAKQNMRYKWITGEK